MSRYGPRPLGSDLNVSPSWRFRHPCSHYIPICRGHGTISSSQLLVQTAVQDPVHWVYQQQQKRLHVAATLFWPLAVLGDVHHTLPIAQKQVKRMLLLGRR